MRLFFLLLLVFYALTGCKPPNDAPAIALMLQKDTDMQVELIPADAPVETLLMLVLTAANVSAISGELYGESMYMGRIPLRFYLQDNNWQADFLLGACSDPAMVWRLELEVEFTDGKKRIVKQQFQSSWR